jgi:excisionase family DNA binding protein
VIGIEGVMKLGNPNNRYVSVPEAGKLLGLKPTAMHGLLDAGVIDFIVPGKHRRVLKSDVIRYRESRKNLDAAIPPEPVEEEDALAD